MADTEASEKLPAEESGPSVAESESILTEQIESNRAPGESDDLFRVITENLPGGVFAHDLDGRIVLVNEAACLNTGYSREELLSMTVREIDQGSVSRNDRQQLWLSLRKGEHVTIQAAHRRKDGSMYPAEVHLNAVTLGGKPAILAVAYDATEQMRLQKALERRVAALTDPPDSPKGVVFEDLFNLDDIQRIQDLFAMASGVASLITRPDGSPITGTSNFCRLCSDIIRKSDKGSHNCQKSDAKLSRLNTEGPIIEPCLSCGLWEAGANITVGGEHIASWLVGQVRDATQTDEMMLEYAREIGADEEAFLAAFHEVPVMSREHFGLVAETLFTLANQLSNTAYQNVQQARMIAERKRTEEALRTSEAQLSNAMKIAQLGYWEYDAAEGMFTFNDQFYAIFRTTATEVGGYKMAPARYANLFVHPDDQVIVDIEMRKAFETTDPNFSRRLEHRIIYADGEIGHIAVRFFIVKDEQGRTVKTFGANQDITEHKRIENNLRQSEEKFRTYISSAPDGVFVVNAEGRYVEVNEAASRMTGYSQKELLDMSILELIGEKNKADGLASFQELRKTGRVSTEVRMRRKDGTVFWASLNAVSLSEERFMAFCADITETKRLRELEMRAQRLETVGQIAGQVAHDFNNLLGPLMAYPGCIRESLPKEHPAHRFLDSMETAAERIADINQQLLTLGRRGHYSQEPLNLNSVVSQVILDMAPDPEILVIETDLDEDLMNIMGGRSQIHRILMNLVSNATDAIHEKGTITIKTDNCLVVDDSVAYGRVPKGEYVRITVTDTGCGIPDNIIQKIFDPFFTSKTTDRKRGSGLGLSVVDAVVKDHNGFLDLTSKVGEGTSFFLYFPVTKEALDSQDTTRASGGSDTVLIVDDDEMQREVCGSLLETLGYKISFVESGEKAVEFIEKTPQDLVVLDMIMPPGIDGTETYRRIIEINPSQKAIIVSGFSETERVTEAQRLGAGAFVKKPLTRDIIAAAVRKVLDEPERTVVTTH